MLRATPFSHPFSLLLYPSSTLTQTLLALAVKLRIESEINLCKKWIPYYAYAKHILFLLIICCTRAAEVAHVAFICLDHTRLSGCG